MNILFQKAVNLLIKTNKGFIAKNFGGMAQIFMIHRILPRHEYELYQINKYLAITPGMLEATIERLFAMGYSFVSLDELHKILEIEEKCNKKYICITLDDGYRDNLTHGLPIFKKHIVPFTIYITNSFPNRTAHFWWYWLEEKLTLHESIHWNNKQFSTKTNEQKQKLYKVIRDEIIKANLAHRSKIITEFFQITPKKLREISEEIALSWHEISRLNSEPLVTIGAHTMNHLSLAHLSLLEMFNEIERSKIQIEEKLGEEVCHFAYPYGSLADVSSREYKIVKRLGFKTATLSHPGNIFLSSRNAVEKLPRYSLLNFTTDEVLKNHLNGVTHFAVNGWRKTHW